MAVVIQYMRVCVTKEHNQEILFALHFDVVFFVWVIYDIMYLQFKNQLLVFIFECAKWHT